jgi:hypothetical protein
MVSKSSDDEFRGRAEVDRRQARDRQRRRVVDSSIGRLIGSEANRGYLRSLPTFRVQKALPSNLAALLEKLERVEEKRAAAAAPLVR